MESVSLMSSAHGLIFYRRPKIGVKISSCALTFGPIKIGPFLPTYLSAIKKSVITSQITDWLIQNLCSL